MSYVLENSCIRPNQGPVHVIPDLESSKEQNHWMSKPCANTEAEDDILLRTLFIIYCSGPSIHDIASPHTKYVSLDNPKFLVATKTTLTAHFTNRSYTTRLYKVANGKLQV